ncbi:MAG: IS630 family transposase [Aridibacter sp.]
MFRSSIKSLKTWNFQRYSRNSFFKFCRLSRVSIEIAPSTKTEKASRICLSSSNSSRLLRYCLNFSISCALYRGGRIDLLFGDESAFSMNPKLPDAWSPKGERIETFPQRDKKVSLFGIFRADNFCVTYESTGNINSDFLIKAIEDFSRYIDKPTVLVLDNAPTHRSAKFLAQMEKWMDRDLYIFFLPKYSPHLNIAETFWRKAKYEWLRPIDYGSFAKFKKKVKDIFSNIGTEYKIAFSQMSI